MKIKNNLKKDLKLNPFLNTIIKKSVISSLLIFGIEISLSAQNTPADTAKNTAITTEYTSPSWWFGAAVGANFNFYQGSTQKLNANLSIPVPFHNGNGVGLFLGPLIEYHRATSKWGFMLQGAYDSRKAEFEPVISPCNCPNELSTKLSYISVEPSLRFAPFKKGLYFYAGPRIAFLYEKSFNYRLVANPDYPEQLQYPDIKGDFSDLNQTLISMQIGAGFDMPLTSKNKQNQFVVSPFVSFQPYFGQSPRSIETWNITTLRGGAAFKFGHGRKNSIEKSSFDSIAETKIKTAIVDSDVVFYVNAPENIPVDRRVRETFPIRNYVFFDLGSTEIPNRYVLLEKDEVEKFTEDKLEVFKPKKLSGRSDRQMIAYYNVLNILGTRMVKKPTTTITLVGSAEDDSNEGKAMAESVKKYLVNIFGIEGSRITTVGNDKPKKPSEVKGGTQELKLLSEGNRRVTIETTSPTLLMEYQTGNDIPLLPVELDALQEEPMDSYVSFNVDGGKENFTSWSIEVKDEKGTIQNYGPYYEDNVLIPGKSILGNRASGDYEITMLGKTKKGKIVKRTAAIHVVKYVAPKDEQGMRYSVLFDYNDSDAAAKYEKYLSQVVAPKIPINATVIIHGHTDAIGDADNNLKLSIARANEVKDILSKSIQSSGRTDVKFEAYGFGEDESKSQFGNNYPEERFYNRSVVIDVIPQK